MANNRRGIGLIGGIAAAVGALLSSMTTRLRAGVLKAPPASVGPFEIPFTLPHRRGGGRRLRPPAARRRLPIARGPGSISARAEHFTLIEAGQLEAAVDLAAAHERQCGERLTYRGGHAPR